MSINWKDVSGLVVGAILGIAGTFFLFQGRVSSLEGRIGSLTTPQPANATAQAQSVATAVAATLTALPTPVAPSATSTPLPTSTPTNATAQAQSVATAVAATLTALPTPVAPSATSTPVPTPAPDAVVGSYGAVMWFEPTILRTYDRVYPAGTPLKVLGRLTEGDWLLAEAPDGHTGWTLLVYLQLNVPLLNVRELGLPPTASSTPTQVVTSAMSTPTAVPETTTPPTVTPVAGATVAPIPTLSPTVTPTSAAPPPTDTPTS